MGMCSLPPRLRLASAGLEHARALRCLPSREALSPTSVPFQRPELCGGGKRGQLRLSLGLMVGCAYHRLPYQLAALRMPVCALLACHFSLMLLLPRKAYRIRLAIASGKRLVGPQRWSVG